MRAGAIMSAYVILYLIIAGMLYFFKRGAVLRDLVDYSMRFHVTVNKLASDLDIPISILDTNGTCVWDNSNFRKLFRQKTGLPPNEFLISIRMEKATDLLYNSPYTIAEIAEIIGYSDSHYFSRLYRKKKGVAPSALTKNASK